MGRNLRRRDGRPGVFGPAGSRRRLSDRGETASYGSGKFDGMAIRTNPIGTVEWQRTYGGTKSDYCYYSVTDNNAWVLIGHTFPMAQAARMCSSTRLLPTGPHRSMTMTNHRFRRFHLESELSNPFNMSTTIAFTLSQRAGATLTIFNVLVRRCASGCWEKYLPFTLDAMGWR